MNINKHLAMAFALLLSINCVAQVSQDIAGAQQIMDKYQLDGAIVIYNQKENKYLTHNPERCNTPFSPASTFKIPNSIIALETGVVTLDTIFKWDGKPKRIEDWQTDMNLEKAFAVSNLPAYQTVARLLGVGRMQYYTRLLQFGTMDVHADNIDTFWLEGKSKITPFQQLYFLKRLYNSELPISEDTMQKVRTIMLRDEGTNYKVRAKTGWSEADGKDVGWFVGWVETADNVYFFVANVEPAKGSDTVKFGARRIDATYDILKSLIGEMK